MKRRIGILLALTLAAGCQAKAPGPMPTLAPDQGRRVVAEHGAVSSAHPAASEAGVEMLRKGGNAIDAAVATAFVIGVTEPQMSGLGGGGGMLIWLQRERRAEYIDFYSAAFAESFRNLGEVDPNTPNLRVVAIPGLVAGLLEAHERFGRLSRAEVMAPAIRIAEEGFPVNQVLAQTIRSDSAKLARFPESMRLLWPNGRPLQPGEILKQPTLAATLRRIAAEGRSGFYEGETAREIVRVLNAGGHPAKVEHLAQFKPQWKRPLCTEYRGRVVLSAPPPQTGVQILHTLNLLERHDLAALGLPTRSADAFAVLASAIRTGATAARHISDPNWATVPAAGLVSDAYAAERAAFVGTGKAVDEIPAGPDPIAFDDAPPAPGCVPLQPYGPAKSLAVGALTAPGATADAAVAFAGRGEVGPGDAQEDIPADGETTHLSVVDAEGNAVALTQTNSTTFGSGAWVAGFFLNDSGYDFSRYGVTEGRSPWRIRNSTIAPTIILEDGRVRMVVGSPGAGRIPPAIIQSIVYVLDYGMDPLEALRMPRIFLLGSGPRIETEHGFSAEVLGRARALGYSTTPDAAGYARIYTVVRQGNRWVAAADPRHNGEARGY
jgi:gamma-glutamyltranspeptidase/glutathione hydrolase